MQPHRSRALIITFIITLVLLIAGYFLLVKNDVLKGNLSLSGKKFNPILGTPKQKDVVVNNEEEKKPDTIVPPDTTSPTPPNDTDTTNAGNKGDTGAVQPISKFVPPNMTFPQPKSSPFTPKNISVSTQCADGVDNDRDGSIDSADNDCHSDGNAKNLSSYVSTYKKEAGSKNVTIVPVTPDPKKKTTTQCTTEDIPLVFTEVEQKRLDELTRQFYRLAPQLKSENDILIEISAKQGYEDIVKNANDLTVQCLAQTSTPKYLQNAIDTEIIGRGWVGNKEVDFINQSSLNKGRTERLRNPYYDSSKEIYPWKESASYFEVYYMDTVSTGTIQSSFKKIWSWQKWESDRGVW